MTDSTPDNSAEPSAATSASAEGVETLFSLLDEMESLGVPVWVHGGWAIDAYTGTTRPHKDLDLVAEEKDRAKLRNRFAGEIVDETTHKIEFLYRSVPVEITFFRRLRNGSAVTETPRILVRWAPDAFPDKPVELCGRSIPVVSLGVLYVECANRVRKKSEMLEKNAHDLERLKSLLDEATCARARRYFPVENTLLNRLRLKLGLL